MLLIILFMLYMFPGILALAKGRKNALAIATLNLLAGWTFVGWLGSLIWALTEGK